MNFQELITNKKMHLKNTQTLITHADGKRFEENSDTRRLGLAPKELKEMPIVHGYVVDNTPDKIPSEVIERLYFGSQDCTESDVIKSYNITHVLSIGVCPEISDIEHKFIPCLDLPETLIYPVLIEANAFIKNALRDNGITLVHCNAGVSRAATIIIGYLILERKMTYDEAYSLVKSKRPCIRPNDGFVKQLKLI